MSAVGRSLADPYPEVTVHRISPLFPAITVALTLGCADSQSPTTPTTVPSVAAENSARIDRGTVGFGFGMDDGSLIVFAGLTVEDLISIFCTDTPFEVDQVNEFVVTRPDGSLKLQLKGDVNVVVLDFAAFEQSFCQDPSAVPTYTGIAQLILNDSDVDITGPGADASMLHLVGTVTDQNGQRYHLVVINQSIVAPEFTSPDDFEFTHTNQKIKLTPFGG
jgi:hypothetical protein